MTEFSEIPEGVTKEPKKTEKILPKESLRVGEKLTITAILLKSRPNPIPEHKEALLRIIKESDGVIFEYFPEETARLSSSPFLCLRLYREEYGRVMAFFTPLADLTKKYDKPAYVLDPAHDKNFAAIMHELPDFFGAVGIWAGGITTSLGLFDLIDRLQNKKVFAKRMTRRQFIGGIGGLSTTALGFASGTYRRQTAIEERTGTPSPGSYPSEAKFRRAIIAKGISQLGENLDKNPEAKAKNLVLFYPPLHWKGLKQLLNNRKKLEKEFKICSILKRGWLKNAFFTARKYEWTGKNWQLEKAEIGGDPGPTL